MESWLKVAGAIGLDDLELADFASLGRGVRTLRPFKEDEKILTIPRDVLWTVEHAYADPLLGPALRAVQPTLSVDDTLAVYILFVRSRTSGYDGPRSHVAAMPARYSSSIYFTEDELDVCAGTSLYTITKQLQRQIDDDYRELVVRLFVPHRNLFPLDEFTIEDYKWALCTVWSRAMDFALADGTSMRLLAPFADMLNHSSDVKQCHVYDASSGAVSILAGKDYAAGDQVYINYGSIPNNRLVRLYGFAIPDNPHESYDLVLSTHEEAPLFALKQTLWAAAGLTSTSTVSLTLTDPLPRRILQYLRIQRLAESDLASTKVVAGLQQTNPAAEKLSDANEAEILHFLIDSLSHHLASFAMPVEQLEAQLADFAPGGNAFNAAQVSLGERKVLQRAKNVAEDLLAALESGLESTSQAFSSPITKPQCAHCGKASESLMLCARCKAVKYCGRTCQVAHFKLHKTLCRAICNVHHAR